MASPHRSDWLTAQEEYLDTLDHKYPGHPYSEQIQKWRDQILLDEAEGRARNLSSPVKTSFSEPHSNSERQYVSFDTLATKAATEGNDALALTYWREMARLVKADDREERPWHLLALERAAKLEAGMQERRAFVIDQLARADAALRAGRPNESVTIRAMLMENYSQYTDLADLLGTSLQTPRPGAGAVVPSSPRTDSEPDARISFPVIPTAYTQWRHDARQIQERLTRGPVFTPFSTSARLNLSYFEWLHDCMAPWPAVAERTLSCRRIVQLFLTEFRRNR